MNQRTREALKQGVETATTAAVVSTLSFVALWVRNIVDWSWWAISAPVIGLLGLYAIIIIVWGFVTIMG